MLSNRQLIVFAVIYGAIVCQAKNLTSAEKRQSENVHTRRNSNQNLQTNKSEEDDFYRSIFIVKDSGLELFNTTQTLNRRTINRSNYPQDVPSNVQQDFKVQRNPDGKLNVVFNEDSLSQISVTQRGAAAAEDKKTAPTTMHKDLYYPDEIGAATPNCKNAGRSFCTDVENYPDQELENIIKTQLSAFSTLFGENDMPHLLNISQRMSPGEDSLCSSVERVIYPKAAETKDLKWLYIVNHQNYTQGVKIEECVNEDEPCMFSENFPNRYVTKCKQNFIFRQLVAFDKSGQVKKDSFKLPSCCKCVYKQV